MVKYWTNNFLKKTIGTKLIVGWPSFLFIFFSLLFVFRYLNQISLKFLLKRSDGSQAKFKIIKEAREPIIFFLLICSILFSLKITGLDNPSKNLIKEIISILIIFNIAWLAKRLLKLFIQNYFIDHISRFEAKTGEEFLTIVMRSSSLSVWVLASVIALSRTEYNFIIVIVSSFMMIISLSFVLQGFLQKLLKQVNNYTPIAFDALSFERNTIKSSRTRENEHFTLNYNLYVKNRDQICENSIINNNPELLPVSPERCINQVLSLSPKIDYRKMDLAVTILKDVANKANHIEDKVYISKKDIYKLSTNLNFTYFVRDGIDIDEVKTNMNLQILKKFKEHNINFAFPSKALTINLN